MQLTEFGQIVADAWVRSREIRQEIDFDAWVIMPNHIHGIVMIKSPDIQPDPGQSNDGVGRMAIRPYR